MSRSNRGGDEILRENGSAVIPDILSNAGGVTVSYFSWVQDLYSFFWDSAIGRSHLERTIRRGYDDVAETAPATARTRGPGRAVGRVGGIDSIRWAGYSSNR